MKVLVGCEYSQVVTNAFREKGHIAFSCDLLPTEGNPDWHIQDNILNHLNDDFDLFIAHPECTYHCNSGVSWLYKDNTRWEKLSLAIEFFKKLLNSNFPRICVENPIPDKYSREKIGDYSQLIQPYQFGHPERKATCLWLKNLPELKHTNNVFEEMKKLPKSQSQRIHYTSPGKNRWKIRSRTFTGIAEAMASQWGVLTTGEK